LKRLKMRAADDAGDERGIHSAHEFTM